MQAQYQHVNAILKEVENWNWSQTQRLQALGDLGGKHHAVTVKFLDHSINESMRLGGTILDQFWNQLGECSNKLSSQGTKLGGNVLQLKSLPFESAQRSLEVLFEGLSPENIDFKPVQMMAAELFTHLGIVILNQGGPKAATGTPHSASEDVGKETQELFDSIAKQPSGRRRQELLKALAFKRDGSSCPVSNWPFRPFTSGGATSQLSHVIPNAVHAKPDTLKCIAMFAGNDTRNEVIQHLNDIDNVMNLELNTHVAYDKLEWAIEAREDSGKVQYLYRTFRGTPPSMFIPLEDGQEIAFGNGPDGAKLGKGPSPRLCNLQHAVARVLRLSGAADLIFDWKDRADDSDFPHVFVASDQFCDILDAKLLLSARTSFV